MMRVSRMLDTHAKVKVYMSFIDSTFMYCPAVWLFCGKTHLNQLEKLNCRALRFVYNDYVSTYDALLLKGIHKSIHVVFMHTLAIKVYKCINGMSPHYMSTIFQREQHGYRIRSRVNLIQPSFRSIGYGNYTFSYLGAKVWNNLPNHVKESASLQTFESRLSFFKDVTCLDRLM